MGSAGNGDGVMLGVIDGETETLDVSEIVGVMLADTDGDEVLDDESEQQKQMPNQLHHINLK